MEKNYKISKQTNKLLKYTIKINILKLSLKNGARI
jgi:hypothetical protein